MSKAIAAIVGSFLVPVLVLAQTPDFSGEWTRVSQRMGERTHVGLGLVFSESPNDRLVIKQDREVLYVEEWGNHGVSHMKYGLVAQRMIQPIETQSDPVMARSRSRWEGTKLLTDFDMDGGGLYELQQVRYLRPDGTMVVEMRGTILGRSSLTWSAVYTRAGR